MNGNATKIKNLISKKTGKIILLKDIHNIKNVKKDKNKLDAVKKILENDYHADSHFGIKDDN